MQQIWEELMKSFELRGKELVDAEVITRTDLCEWLNSKGGSQETVGCGLPSYAFLQCLLSSVEAGSSGLLLLSGMELTQENRPQDRLLDWFFHPIMVLKEQIRVIQMGEEEIRFLEKSVLFVGDAQGMESWNNGSVAPPDALKFAQIQAISRRLVGMIRSISKLPTYRRRYRQVVKILVAYCLERDGSAPASGSVRSGSVRSISSMEIVAAQV